MASENEIEIKNIINAIVNKLIKVFSIDRFRNKIDGFVKEEYFDGMEKSEVEFDMNFTPESDVSFLSKYVNNNLEFITDEMGHNLRGALSRGLMDRDNLKQLKTRIKTVFSDKKYVNRMKMVVRTEKNRANNTGALDGARQAERAGVKVKKYVDVLEDGVTSPICSAMDTKYGSEDKAIGLDKDFFVTVKSGNKTITVREQAPPFHPNCRSVLRFKRIKNDN